MTLHIMSIIPDVRGATRSADSLFSLYKPTSKDPKERYDLTLWSISTHEIAIWGRSRYKPTTASESPEKISIGSS